jgi:hypothetical protein
MSEYVDVHVVTQIHQTIFVKKIREDIGIKARTPIEHEFNLILKTV